MCTHFIATAVIANVIWTNLFHYMRDEKKTTENEIKTPIDALYSILPDAFYVEFSYNKLNFRHRFICLMLVLFIDKLAMRPPDRMKIGGVKTKERENEKKNHIQTAINFK